MEQCDTNTRHLEGGAGGDPQAFWPLWEKHEWHLRHLCHRLLQGHPDDAEDALSETMLKAWAGLPGHAAEIGSPGRWLRQIAFHCCVDSWRRRARLTHYSEVAEEISPARAPLPEELAEDPAEIVLRREMQGCALSLVGSLPSRLRGPMVLHALHELPYADVAARLRITEVNARKRVQQARGMLNRLWDTYAAPTPEEKPALPSPPLIADPLRQHEALLRDLPPAPPAEIAADTAGSEVAQVPLPSGAVMDYHLDLPTRAPHRDTRIETLRRHVERYPRGWKKRLELADLLYAAGQWPAAAAEYAQVLERHPRLLDVWVRLGRVHRLIGDGESALAVYQKALSYTRQPATRLHLTGLAALCQRRYAEAFADLAEAARLQPDNRAHWHALGLAYHDAGQPAEALEAFDEALKLDPGDAAALVNSRDPLVALGRPLEAERRVERAVQAEPNCVLALVLLATHRCTAGRVSGREGQRTRRLIAQALKLAPDATDAWGALAHFHVRRGDAAAGLQALEAFVERHPNRPQGWLYRSEWLFHCGHYPEAADAALRANALYPHDLAICQQACKVLPFAGRLDELRAIVDDLLAHYPGRWESCGMAARVLAGWLDAAEAACELAAEGTRHQERVVEAWLTQGQVLAAAGRYRPAVEALEQALSLLPADDGHAQRAAAAHWLGVSCRSLGDEAQAARWFTAAAAASRDALAGDPSGAHYALGNVLAALGRTREAARAYRTAINLHLLYPDREIASEFLDAA